MKTIYFDNAATTNFKPFCVKYALIKSLNRSANPGRSGHKLSIENAQLVWKTREKIAQHFGDIEPENVIFTKNCTEAINIALQGLAKLHLTGNVIVSTFEHNSVLRPLHEIQKKSNLTLTIIKPENKKFITQRDVEKAIQDDTFLVCVNSFSNVTGNKNSFEKIAKLCSRKGILYLLDNAQGAGHININMKELGINFLTFSGHKGFHTPQGIGALCINSIDGLPPLMFGGTGTESDNLYQPLSPPESLESGTLATPLITSLNAGINYIEKHPNHQAKLEEITEYLSNEISKIPNVILYSTSLTTGIVSFNIKGFDSIEICDYLSENFGIACRGGLHCAPLAHHFLNTLESGIVRLSLSFKSTKRQVNTLINALKKLVINN